LNKQFLHKASLSNLGKAFQPNQLKSKITTEIWKSIQYACSSSQIARLIQRAGLKHFLALLLVTSSYLIWVSGWCLLCMDYYCLIHYSTLTQRKALPYTLGYSVSHFSTNWDLRTEYLAIDKTALR